MADSDSVLVVVDGATPSAFRSLGGKQDGAGFFRPTHGLRSDSNDVGMSYPLPVQTRPISPVFSQAFEAAHILHASPCTLYAFQANFTNSGWVLLFDSATVPADGAVVPVKAWQVSSSTANTLDKSFSPPLQMTNGAVLVFSSSGPFQKTASAVAQFSGEVV